MVETPHVPDANRVRWFALCSSYGELSPPGGSPEDARKAHEASLLRFHGKKKGTEAEILARVARDLALFDTGVILSGEAPSEEAAFRIYAIKADVRGVEAFRRWRLGFPRSADVCALLDPLIPAISRFESGLSRRRA